MAHARPRSLTLLGWLFIGFGTLSFFLTVPQLGSPEVQASLKDAAAGSRNVQIAYVAALVLVPLLMVSSGIGVLRGRNWARWLVLLWGVGAIAANLALREFSTRAIPGLVLYAGILFLLFRPQATAYFRSRSR